MAYASMNPTTGEALKSFDEFSDAQVESTLATALSCYEAWRRTDFPERKAKLLKVADLLDARAEEYGKLMALEVGKPVIEGEGETKKSALCCRFYAEHAEEFLKPHVVTTDASKSYVQFDPLGPVLAIMPWNYPFWQVFRFACPALMAGNVVLLKHTHHTPELAIALQDIFEEAGYPKGALQYLFVSNEQAAKIIGDDRVRGVTLTGSTGAGKNVAETSGRNLKKTVLELGGSDPFIVFDDADIEEASSVGVAARCLNSGQSCIAAKRFLIHSAVYDQFVSKLVEKMNARVMGDPFKRETNIGPMARLDLRDGLADQVERSVAAGAKLLAGGKIPEGPGFFYPPTVLADPPEGSPARVEEFFGPIATVIRFNSEEEAISIANETEFGLGASVWTQTESRQLRMINEVEAGAVFINGLVKSDPRIPFGGIKNSGYGRELAREGMIEFTNQKTVWIK